VEEAKLESAARGGNSHEGEKKKRGREREKEKERKKEGKRNLWEK